MTWQSLELYPVNVPVRGSAGLARPAAATSTPAATAAALLAMKRVGTDVADRRSHRVGLRATLGTGRPAAALLSTSGASPRSCAATGALARG